MLFRKPRRKVNRVFIHCSASDLPEHDNIEVIRQWHLARGFDDIGYHFFIHKNGNVSIGRSLERTPAAQRGQNRGTIAICLHGFHIERFTQAQYNTLRNMANYINSIYYERISFHGHEEVAHKSCPILNYRAILKLDRYGSIGLTPSYHASVAPSVTSSHFVELRYGDRGEAVRKLQQLLHIKVTGIYKRQTLAKVKDFKRQHGLYPSGIVTKQVWKLLTRPILSQTPPTQHNTTTIHPVQTNYLNLEKALVAQQ